MAAVKKRTETVDARFLGAVAGYTMKDRKRIVSAKVRKATR
jgi:hypothetical protein